MNPPPGSKPVTLLLVEDDPDDRLLAQDALQKSNLPHDLRFVADGEELMRYLRRAGEYAAGEEPPRPGLILLDLNLPRKDGREALKEIKEDPKLREIPVVVLTTSESEEDIRLTYRYGGNSFITKPVEFGTFVEVMKSLAHYWLEVVELPRQEAMN